MNPRANVLLGIQAATEYLKAQGIYIKSRRDIFASVKVISSYITQKGIAIDAEKTRRHYERVLRNDIRDFYNQEIEVGEYIDAMIGNIENQFTRAWHEGAENVGFMEDISAHLQPVMEYIAEEENYILDLGQQILDAAAAGDPVQQFYSRAELWSNRYNEIVNEAEIYFGKLIGARLIWQLGATEEHCATCAALDGIVALAEEWERLGLHPQGAPNDKLECGGWRCDCSLFETTDPLTEGGIPSV